MGVRSVLRRTAGGAASRAALAYRGTIGHSLVGALLRDPDVLAVYARDSDALVVVVADRDVDGELAQLERLARSYRRHQAIAQIDLAVLSAGTFATAAGRLAQRRGRMGSPGPVVPVSTWQPLGGEDLRTGSEAAPADDWYVTEAHVARAVRAAGRHGDVRHALRDLIHDVEREQLDWPSARRLLQARDDTELICAALELTDAQRDRVPIAATPRSVTGWVAPPAPPAPHGEWPRVGRAMTLHHPPFASRPELIVEGEPEELARWAVRDGAARAVPASVDLRLATPRLAEEGWRCGMRAASILLAAVPLAGPPLSERLRLPADEVLREQAAAHAQALLMAARAALLGHRGSTPDPLLPERLAVWRVVADGGPLLGEEHALRAAVPALAEREWGRRALSAAR